MTDDPMPLSKIIKRIKNKYDKDDDEEKKNWKVRGGTDEQGNKDMLITRDPDAWYVKSKQIDPVKHISFGNELYIRNLDEDIQSEIGKKKFD
ncbi:MAG: hypothetical protein GF364_17320, partial [Candidatus Lokiarchaeota archaeon]|nr:hypothetical protein [Candidatus Lokiarchaeota archaeon]